MAETALSALANLPGAAVFVVDRQLRYVLAGGEALSVAGYTSAGLVGRTVEEALGPTRGTMVAASYRRVLAGESIDLEHQERGRLFLTRGVPLRDADGRIRGALALSTDITERAKTRSALHARVESSLA